MKEQSKHPKDALSNLKLPSYAKLLCSIDLFSLKDMNE